MNEENDVKSVKEVGEFHVAFTWLAALAVAIEQLVDM